MSRCPWRCGSWLPRSVPPPQAVVLHTAELAFLAAQGHDRRHGVCRPGWWILVGTLTMRCHPTCRTRDWPRPARRPAPWRRATAGALVALLAVLLLAPSLEAASTAADGRCCRRGVCCHHRSAADTTCVRGLCPCGGHEGGPTLSPTQFEAILPVTGELWTGPSPADPLCALTGPPQAVDLSPPYHPPRLSL